MIEFEWDGAVYQVNVAIEGLKEENPVFELPSGEKLEADKWFPTKPPRPMNYKLAEDQTTIGYSAIKLRDVEKKALLPLSKYDLSKKIHKGRVKVILHVTFEEVIAFCGLRAFDDYVDDVILGSGELGQIKSGNLSDIEYKVLSVDADNTLVLEVTADASALKM